MLGIVVTSGGGGGKNSNITFSVNVENAEVIVKDTINNIIAPVAPNKYKLKAGIYLYSVVADGYFTPSKQQLFAYEDRTININLDKKLYINFSVYPLDAEIIIKDGNNNVVEPIDGQYIVKAGQYSYSVIKSSYASVENVAFSITDEEEVKNIDVTLVPSIFGIRRQISSTSTVWERIGNSVGMVAEATHDGTPVQNDFDRMYPWCDIISCDVSPNGKINSYYGDATFSFTNPVGHIMTLIPEFYYKREQKDGYEYIYISKENQTGFKKSNKFMLGRYDAGGSGSTVNNKSGVAPYCDITLPNARTYSKNIGSNWGLLDIFSWSMVQLLYLVEYADYDSQKTLGLGISSGSISNSGGCDDLGMKSGCLSNTGTTPVIYRGLENVFGNVFQWLDGVNITSRQAWVSKNPSDYVSDKYSSPYTKLGYVCPSSNGYISKLGYDTNNPEIQMPIEAAGSSSSNIPDYYYQSSSNYVVCVGGYFSCSSSCGLWYWYCDCASSNANGYIGFRVRLTPV